MLSLFFSYTNPSVNIFLGHFTLVQFVSSSLIQYCCRLYVELIGVDFRALLNCLKLCVPQYCACAYMPVHRFFCLLATAMQIWGR